MKNLSVRRLIVFICFLVLGYSVSTKLFQSENGNDFNMQGLITSGINNPIPSMNNGQRSILLIGVDTLRTSNPKLAGLWLVTYLPTNSILHLLPIYPSEKDILSDFEKRISHAFDIDKSNGELVPGRKFVQILEENNYWWSGYLIIDQVVMTEILHLLGSTENYEEITQQNQKVLEMPVVENDKHNTFSTQLAIVQTACHQLAGITQNPDWSKVISLIPDHILTNLDIQQFKLEWEELFSLDQIPICRFPTLEFSRADQ